MESSNRLLVSAWVVLKANALPSFGDLMKNNKSLGQHWLKNRAILKEIADFAAVSGASLRSEKTDENEVCVEIGPGLGTLTSSLLKRFYKVIAIEFDGRLAANLPKSFPGKNLEVKNEDVLKYDFERIDSPYVIVGNIPYYITSPIIEKILKLQNKPRRIVLLIQKEVTERIVDTKETVLSLFVKNNANVWAGPIVPRSEFTPPPKVDSQVIILEPKQKPDVSDEVFDLIKIGFGSPRKKLIHNLNKIKSEERIKAALALVGLDTNVRAGDLTIKDWAKLKMVL